MKKKRKAELCDAIIAKFKGDVSHKWTDLHGKDYLFNDLILDSECEGEPTKQKKYSILQPIINFLLDEGVLRRNDVGKPTAFLNLTDKGNAIYGDFKSLGYVTKRKEIVRKRNWQIFLGFISISTFIMVGFRFYNDFMQRQNKTVQPIMEIKQDKNILDSVQTNKDSILKQTPIKK